MSSVDIFKICLTVAFICKNYAVNSEEYSPVVTIPDGSVRGIVNQTVSENVTYYAYRGIPYAQPPIGDLRFASPVENDAWTDVLNATSEPSQCTQISDSEVVGSEDCLYINVYTTNLNSSLPVMVYIYGGAFVSGSTNSSGTPDYLLEKDIVFVIFNYRLGVFGFLSTEDTALPGNLGIKDQILALKWVQNNIEYFGGDPDKVTIFGESAGAASVSYILTNSNTSDLYQNAIMQSGTVLCLWTLARNASVKAFKLGTSLGIITDNSTYLVEQLREVDYKELKSAENTLTTLIEAAGGIVAGLPFAVVIEPDIDGAIVTGRSYEKLLNGDYNTVPVIVGFNSFEMENITNTFLVNIIASQFEVELWRLAPYDLTSSFLYRTSAGTIVRNYFFGILPIAVQSEAIANFATVDQFDRPIRETVDLMSQHNDVYYYEFSYAGNLGSPNRTDAGVAHAEDVNYIFVTSNDEYATDEDQLTRQRIITLWTNFAKTGDPTSSDPLNVLQNITWTPNNSETNTSSAVNYLDINSTLSMGTNPKQTGWEFYLNEIYSVYGDSSYYTTY
ncbi:venom carboxylesterase-6-like [Sitophilus oryzae]|uniref:Carboxylic ester hydrolase n=1 Tax=Sitophilus oryzae TaxID=7048 RepID=A0A6J2YMR0_SITOR|nr:venom carboxylesterase-6-like [Sitophilus oryzae]